MGTQIDQDIPELPIPPYKNVDSGATFVAKAEAFRQALKDTFQPAMNYVIGKMNIISDEVSTNATNAETAANIATAAANYKGDWIAGYNTTGYSVGMSVTFTDGFNYISKINNNLVSPTSKTNTTQWGWIEKYENLDGYDAKTTPDNADLLPLSDSTTNFSVKKITWANIKNTIINSFYSMIGGLSSKTTVGVLDEFVINDSGTSTKKVTYQNLINTIATSFGGMINTLIAKTTPVDADIFPIADSVDSNATKKLTWANIKATIISSFGAMIATLTPKITPVDADGLIVSDSAASNASKFLSLANLKATIFTSPAFTGTPTAPTPTAGDNSTQVATTAFCTSQDLGVGQTLQNVTTNRFLNTNYSNTSTKPKEVKVSVQIVEGSKQLYCTIGANQIILGYTPSQSNNVVSGSIIIPPNTINYSIGTNGTSTLISWQELA